MEKKSDTGPTTETSAHTMLKWKGSDGKLYLIEDLFDIQVSASDWDRDPYNAKIMAMMISNWFVFTPAGVSWVLAVCCSVCVRISSWCPACVYQHLHTGCTLMWTTFVLLLYCYVSNLTMEWIPCYVSSIQAMQVKVKTCECIIYLSVFKVNFLCHNTNQFLIVFLHNTLHLCPRTESPHPLKGTRSTFQVWKMSHISERSMSVPLCLDQ